MATSSYKSFLMTNATGLTGGEWTKLCDVKSYPNIGGTPEKLPTTTLSDIMETSINGIQSTEVMEFSANYDKAVYDTLSALTQKQQAYAIWFGGTGVGQELTPTGTEGKYKFMAELSIRIDGKGVNEVREMTIFLTPSTEIVPDKA